MAKDDYFVIVYQILSYLYQHLKRGESVDARMISAESDLYTIPRSYWLYIMENLVDENFVTGPKGIQYLCDNSLMEKAKALFKDAKEMIPFI